MFIDRLFTLAANLLPLAGVWWWGWDAFEVLILYWMQTVVVVVFAVLNIRKVPEDGLGTMKIDGVPHRATRRHYIIMFSIIGVMFCAAHLVFLFVFFSGDWTKVVRGPVTFWQTFVIRNGAWLPLLLSVLAALARYLLTPPRSAALRWTAARLGLKDNDAPGAKIDGLFTALFMRIFAMQAAIIFGAMLLMSYGAKTAPLLILIGLKTLFELAGTVQFKTQVITSLRR